MSLAECALVGIFKLEYNFYYFIAVVDLWYEDYIQNVGTLMHCNVQFFAWRVL